MTIHSGLVILLRLFLLFALLNTARQAVDVLLLFNGGTPPGLMGSWLVMTAFAVTIQIGLFVAAGRIVDWLAPKDGKAGDQRPISLVQLQAVAFSAVGAILLILAIRDGFSAILLFFGLDHLTAALSQFFLSPLVSGLGGLYLLIGAPLLAPWLARRMGGG